MVFLAAGDDSEKGDRTGPYLHAGFVAPVSCWTDYFAPAWEERVLNLSPAVSHFHLAERNRQPNSERRIDEATRVIGSTGSLLPVATAFNGSLFREAFRGTKTVRSLGNQPGAIKFSPDFLAFIGFAYAAVDFVSREFPEAERIDFLVERKTSVSHHLPDFTSALAQSLELLGRRHLAKLIGEVVSAKNKESIPLQAADCFAGHLRVFRAGTASRTDVRRLERMLNGRGYMGNGATDDDLIAMASRSKLASVPNPFPHPKRFPSNPV